MALQWTFLKSAIGWKQHKVKGDGNYLYQAISKAVTGDEDNHLLLCLFIQRFENFSQDPVQRTIDWYKSGIKNHVLYMGLPGTMGSYIEIFTIANCLGILVFTCTVSNYDSHTCIKWEQLKLLFPPTLPCATSRRSLWPSATLLHEATLLYNCILSSSTNTLCTQTPSILPSVSSLIKDL